MRVGPGTFTCPEGKEASVTLGCEILAATSENGREVVGGSQVLQGAPDGGARWMGHTCLWSWLDWSRNRHSNSAFRGELGILPK